jgi:hypothetical protein
VGCLRFAEVARCQPNVAFHLQYRGEANVQGEKSWDVVVLEDFSELRKSGLTHPLMDEIEKEFKQ